MFQTFQRRRRVRISIDPIPLCRIRNEDESVGTFEAKSFEVRYGPFDVERIGDPGKSVFLPIDVNVFVAAVGSKGVEDAGGVNVATGGGEVGLEGEGGFFH